MAGCSDKANTLPRPNKMVANGAIDYRRITSRKRAREENHIVELAVGVWAH